MSSLIMLSVPALRRHLYDERTRTRVVERGNQCPTQRFTKRIQRHVPGSIRLSEIQEPHIFRRESFAKVYSKSKTLETAREVLRTEADAITRLIERLDDSFERAVELLVRLKDV